MNSSSAAGLYEKLVAQLAVILGDLNDELGEDAELRSDVVDYAIQKRVEAKGGESPKRLNETCLAQAALDLAMGWKPDV